MNLVNHTPFAADYTMTHDPAGRECLVAVVKATYLLPLAGEAPVLAERQQPITHADTATGAPGRSAPLLESDFCLAKPKVDVLLLASAHQPGGQPAARVGVGFSVGALQKTFVVTGNRYWRSRLIGGMVVSDPEPFTRQPISYDIAFGGTVPGKTPAHESAVFAANPVGLGYLPCGKFPDGTPGPQTEVFKKPITSSTGAYAPMAFGPVGRHWQPRAPYAGTYDERWRRERFPLLPEDFDARYFQAAPADQQIDRLTGGEPVRLLHLTPAALTPSGVLDFKLPDLALRIVLQSKTSGAQVIDAKVDTLLIEPDALRFSVVWRAVHDLAGDAYAWRSIEIGEQPPGHVVRIPLEVLAGELPSRDGGPGRRS